MKVRRSVAKDERAFVKAALGSRKNARVQRVAVNPGYGPGHAENALEGDLVDSTKIPKLKFQHGEEDVVSGPGRAVQRQLELERLQKLLAGGGAQSAEVRQLYDKYGLTAPEEQLYPRIPYEEVEPQLARKGVKAVQGNTDSVPAMLTPREAVLNRNAAEMAGRGRIAKLNEAGNKLAVRGVDLAASGDEEVPDGGKSGWVPSAGEMAMPPIYLYRRLLELLGGGGKKGEDVPEYKIQPGDLPEEPKAEDDLSPEELRREQLDYQRRKENEKYLLVQKGTKNVKKISYGGTKKMQKGGLVPQPYGDAKFGQGNDPRRLGGPALGGEPPGAYGRGGGGAKSQKPPNISSPGVKAPFTPPPLPRGWNAWQGLGGGGVSNQPTPWRDPGPVGGGVPGPIGGPLGLGGGGGVTNWMGGYGGGVTNWMGGGSGSFYPPPPQGNVVGGNPNLNKPWPGFQSGVADLGGPGVAQNYGPAPQLQGADIGNLIAALTKAGQQQGMSPQQIQGLLSAVQGMGGGGGGGQLYGSGGGAISGLTASGGFQGGISDIGYPPMVGPNMDYHADKGSTWVGPYDPAYMINRQP